MSWFDRLEAAASLLVGPGHPALARLAVFAFVLFWLSVFVAVVLAIFAAAGQGLPPIR